MAGVVVEKLPGEDFLEEVPRICYLAVDPDFQKKGLGSMLVRHCEDWAAARGHEAIWLFHNSEKDWLVVNMFYFPIIVHILATIFFYWEGHHPN